MNKTEQKKELNNASKKMNVPQNFKEVKRKLKDHVGFEEEKKDFEEAINYYIEFQGKIIPLREITGYAGPPGTGKTTFVKALGNALERPVEIIPCAGLSDPSEYSILGDENKPSLVAWVILKNGCRNPIILLDELEKVKDEKIQADLIKIFETFKKEGTYFDPYFQQEIDLKHLNFFVAVNYSEKLATKLKDEIKLKELLGYKPKEKKQILEKKRAEMQKTYNLEKDEIEKILSDDILEFLIKEWIQEKGVRKLEQAAHKIVEEYIYAKKTNREEFPGGKKLWVQKNILPFRENFKPKLKHHLLFASLGLSLILSITWIFTRFLLRPAKKEKQEKQRREDE